MNSLLCKSPQLQSESSWLPPSLPMMAMLLLLQQSLLACQVSIVVCRGHWSLSYPTDLQNTFLNLQSNQQGKSFPPVSTWFLYVLQSKHVASLAVEFCHPVMVTNQECVCLSKCSMHGIEIFHLVSRVIYLCWIQLDSFPPQFYIFNILNLVIHMLMFYLHVFMCTMYLPDAHEG